MLRRSSTSTLFPYTTLFRSVPITVEIVIAVMIVILWLLSKTPAFPRLERGWLLTGAGLAALVSLAAAGFLMRRSEEHTSELQSRGHLVCRLLLVKKTRLRQF